MNRIINDINSSSVTELNTAYALFLHKGHGKERTSDRSYRTISTCPVVAKGLDMFLHDLFIDDWNESDLDKVLQALWMAVPSHLTPSAGLSGTSKSS